MFLVKLEQAKVCDNTVSQLKRQMHCRRLETTGSKATDINVCQHMLK